MSYYFFIGTMMLPVPPAKMSLKIKNRNKTINLINEGEVNLIKNTGLSEISFDARLPNTRYPFANYDTSIVESLASQWIGSSFSFKNANHFLNQFEALREEKVPTRLIISRMTPGFRSLWDTNLLVTLEEYSVLEDAGEGFDVTVPLRFKQYRPYGTKECEVTKAKNGKVQVYVKPVRATPDQVVPTVYQIRGEQSIWEACKKASGGNLDWRGVMRNNGIGNPIGNLAGRVLDLV